MEKLAKAFGVIFLFIAAIIFYMPLNVLMGAVAGWGVSLFFDAPIQETLAAFGIPMIPLWKLGATAGFFGVFMRTHTTVKQEK